MLVHLVGKNTKKILLGYQVALLLLFILFAICNHISVVTFLWDYEPSLCFELLRPTSQIVLLPFLFRKRKVRKSKAFVDDDDDDEEDDKNIATASTQEENHSGEEGNVNKAQKQPSDEEMADDNLQVDERPQSPVEESDDDEKRNTGPSSDSDLD